MIAIAACAAAFAGVAAGPAQAGQWLPPTAINVSTGTNAAIGLDATGDVFAAWQTNPGAPTASAVQGAHHVVGGSGFPQLPDFSTDTTSLHGNGTPVLVTNRAGDGLVAWINDQGGSHYQVQFRTISPNGTTGPVVSVGLAMTTYDNLTAAINANGDAILAWRHSGAVEAITRQGLNGTFTNLATPNNFGAAGNGPAVAIDGAGNAIVVWQSGATIVAERHPAAGPWTAMPDILSAGGHLYSLPSIAANPAGQMVVAFSDIVGIQSGVSAVTGTAAGGWGPSPTPTPLATAGAYNAPGVVVDDSGGAVVGWSTNVGAQVAVRPAGGSFPAPANVQTVSGPASPDNFTLVGNGRGDAVLAWSTFENGPMQNIVRAAVKAAGSNAFGASQIVSDQSIYAAFPTIALDNRGDALVAYNRGTSGMPLGIGAAIYDGAGPLLGTPTGPATVAEGAHAAFSVPQPLDAFSNPVSVKWSFGDGSAAATGASVTHTFAATGTFTVTVTATDAVGNSTSTTVHVTVTGGPPGSHCVVPKLKGKSLSRATSLLKAAHCALGKVGRPKPRKHHKLGKLVVKSSSPGAGSTRPAGTKVNLKLTQAPKHKAK